ncbi:MAG TPA: hypothetical protein VJ728_14195 [Candidatus Binataceae bacterium]|nr:hypothetical protein [Candidatus Binataceae bacterium]
MTLLRERAARRGIGAIEPCLPSSAKQPPSGPGWLHDIKHFTHRFPFIALAVGKLPVQSCLIDGEAIVCEDNGLAVFELIRR